MKFLRLWLSVMLPLMILVPLGCASDPPPRPIVVQSQPPVNYRSLNIGKINTLVRENAGWQAWIDSAATAQEAYHFIVDTPIEQIDRNMNIVSAIITKARDSYRRALSFGLSDPELRTGNCHEPSSVAKAHRSINGSININSGMRIIYEGYDTKRKRPYCYEGIGHIKGIASSRDLYISRRDLYGQQIFVEPFLNIVEGDQVDIRNIIVRIKRES